MCGICLLHEVIANLTLCNYVCKLPLAMSGSYNVGQKIGFQLQASFHRQQSQSCLAVVQSGEDAAAGGGGLGGHTSLH